MRTHQQVDARSLALHRLIAEKLRRDPMLFSRAQQTLQRWRNTVSPESQAYLCQWQTLLDAGADVALAVATEDSQRGAALRQCSPLGGVLSNAERFAFLRSWRGR